MQAAGLSEDTGDVALRGFRAKELLAAWDAAVRRLRLDFCIECAYQLRHGGASRDRLLNLRTNSEIQRRGQWAQPPSLRIYEKPGRLQQILHQTSPRVLEYAAL